MAPNWYTVGTQSVLVPLLSPSPLRGAPAHPITGGVRRLGHERGSYLPVEGRGGSPQRGVMGQAGELVVLKEGRV